MALTDKARKPKYREAYPRLSSYEVHRAFRAEFEICQFFNESGKHCGDAGLMAESPGLFRIRYQFLSRYLGHPEGEELIRYEAAPNGVDSERIFFRCNRCERRVAILVFDQFWACAKCHRLLYRNQLAAPGTSRMERMMLLENQIGRGRPHGMRHTTYEKKLVELEQLRSDPLMPTAKVASERYSLRIDARWKPISDVAPIDIYPYVLQAIPEDVLHASAQP